jgi:hypothetical protein
MEIDEKKVEVEANSKGKFFKCPHCKCKYEWMKFSQGYKRFKNGQLVRIMPKLSKKQKKELKRRVKNERKANNSTKNA